MTAPKVVVVRGRGWRVDVPAIIHPGGDLEFAAGNKRPYDSDTDEILPAKDWQVREFWMMREDYEQARRDGAGPSFAGTGM